VKRKTKTFLSTIFLIATIAIFLSVQISKAQTGDLKVWIFDVGQGDSIFIKTPKGIDVLIDGGEGKDVLEELGEALPFWDHHINLVILTHPHADHVNGLVEVLKRYDVDQILEPGKNSETSGYLGFLHEIENNNIKKTITKSEQKILLEDNIFINILWPESNVNEIEDINDTSIVTKLSYGNIDFLLTGDATSEVEKEILDQNLDSEFLKVGHHGSRYSSSANFLAQVGPLVSFISAGKDNRFNHPHDETLTRLEEVGSKILRTDQNGTIKVTVEEDGDWDIWCEKDCN